ncbi:MAG TPA: hypothetical protein VHG32_24000 [Thermoanaerobaculia bacterium]|jgi:hypothetical protein|nr:hypothetical protein [Thermoanaerobaculia bacterium]
MISRLPKVLTLIVMPLIIYLLSPQVAPAQTFQVVNMIPNSLSGETNCDAEPNLAVNPANPQQIAASAFTPDPLSSNSGPIFVSTNGGTTWTLNVVLPGGDQTDDVTLRFAETSGILYAGILRHDNSKVSVLSKAGLLTSGLMNELASLANADQPYIQATTFSGLGVDRVYMGYNDLAAHPKNATVEQSLDAAQPSAYVPEHIEARTSCDGPSIRTAVHSPSGTVYATFFRWNTCKPPISADVIVVRDDAWGGGLNPYSAIGVNGVGVAVASGISIASMLLGSQRVVVGSSLTIAVDPRDPQTLYVAWADGTTAATSTLHLRRSSDGGATWSGDLRSLAAATNPALAVNNQGWVGFLYQKLTSANGKNVWETHLELSDSRFAKQPADAKLAIVSDTNDSCADSNPLGDYDHLMAVGKDFYGIFSAYNLPDLTAFPMSVVYQRNVDWNHPALKDLAGHPGVPFSIDPFFFVVKMP